jgi:hypothetical protein
MAPTRDWLPEMPELEKQRQVIASGKAETVQEFIDWLLAQDLFLASWQVDDMRYNKDILVEDPRSPEQLMADFFGIDRCKVEQEREALLKSLRDRSEFGGPVAKHNQDDCDCEWPTDDPAVGP